MIVSMRVKKSEYILQKILWVYTNAQEAKSNESLVPSRGSAVQNRHPSQYYRPSDSGYDGVVLR